VSLTRGRNRSWFVLCAGITKLATIVTAPLRLAGKRPRHASDLGLRSRSFGALEARFAVRRLAVLLIADAHAYCRLMAADEALAYATFIGHRRLMQAVVDGHGGRTVGGAGDSLLAEFASVERAMQAAITMQDHLREANQRLRPDRKLEFRVGVNLGDVLDDGCELHGHSVNIAARLQALAAPGGIALSSAVREQVRGKLRVALRDGGWRRVKNIAEPLRVFHVDHRRGRGIGDIARSSTRRAIESAMAALAAALTFVL
jgi:class 3 adenylate cyclase